MKNPITFLCFLLFLSSHSIGQGTSFPDNNAVWKEGHIIINGIAGPTYTGLCGDTLIAGVIYTQCITFYVDVNQQVVSSDYLGGLRSEGEQVWFVEENADEEYLLYDFGLEAGDSIPLIRYTDGEEATLYVDEVSSISIGNEDRKVIHLAAMGIPTGEYWIEGIGSNWGLLSRGWIQINGYYTFLACFQHEDVYYSEASYNCQLPELACELINAVEEPQEAAISVFPNPVGDYLQLSVSGLEVSNDWIIRILSADGRLLSIVERESLDDPGIDVSMLPGGVYVLEVTAERDERVGAVKFVKQ